jgi:uncharacterized protein HemY
VLLLVREVEPQLSRAADSQVLEKIGELSSKDKPFREAKAALQTSIDALRTDALSNPELWVKLARCAYKCRSLSQAVHCARAALEDTTSTAQALALSAHKFSSRASNICAPSCRRCRLALAVLCLQRLVC